MHPDPVIDYLIMEAVYLGVQKEDAEAQQELAKQREQEAFRQEAKKRLKQHVHGSK